MISHIYGGISSLLGESWVFFLFFFFLERIDKYNWYQQVQTGLLGYLGNGKEGPAKVFVKVINQYTKQMKLLPNTGKEEFVIKYTTLPPRKRLYERKIGNTETLIKCPGDLCLYAKK